MASRICSLLAYSSYFIHIDPHCADPQTELSLSEKSRHGTASNKTKSVELLPQNQLNLSYRFGLNFLRKPLFGFNLSTASFKSGVGLAPSRLPLPFVSA